MSQNLRVKKLYLSKDMKPVLQENTDRSYN